MAMTPSWPVGRPMIRTASACSRLARRVRYNVTITRRVVLVATAAVTASRATTNTVATVGGNVTAPAIPSASTQNVGAVWVIRLWAAPAIRITNAATQANDAVATTTSQPATDSLGCTLAEIGPVNNTGASQLSAIA